MGLIQKKDEKDEIDGIQIIERGEGPDGDEDEKIDLVAGTSAEHIAAGTTAEEEDARAQCNLGFFYYRGIGVEEAAAERIAFLVGHHHTLTGVDGIDWQILLEADFLVNSQEKAMSLSAIRRAEETFFRTESGRKLLHAQYPGLDEAE